MMKKVLRILPFVFIYFLALFFRFTKLGYSEFQGDETSAQNYLFGNQDFIKFLFTRQVGPSQYIISYISNYLLHFVNLSPELFIRIPFAFAGITAVIALYYVVNKFFDRTTALIATTLAGTSGLLIALSRIVQYQSFVILLSIVCVGVYLVYLERDHNILYSTICGILCGVALLFHYDALAFIIPIIIHAILNKDYKGIVVILGFTGIISSLFYVPFVLYPGFSSTFDYLIGTRMNSSPTQDSIWSSLKILEMYHSKELLMLVGIALVIALLKRIKNSTTTFTILLSLTVDLILIRVGIGTRIPWVVYGSVICAIATLYMYCLKKTEKDLQDNALKLITIWFGVSFICYGMLFSMPLTHIYTFFTPLFILIGFYLKIAFVRAATFQKIGIIGLALFGLVSAVSFNYQAFIDTTREYPWEQKKYVFGLMPSYIADGQNIDGIFGFPYNRGWKGIAGAITAIKKFATVTTYGSNEKYRLTKYYIRDLSYVDKDPDIYVYIYKTQNLVQAASTHPAEIPLVTTGDYEIYLK